MKGSESEQLDTALREFDTGEVVLEMRTFYNTSCVHYGRSIPLRHNSNFGVLSASQGLDSSSATFSHTREAITPPSSLFWVS